MSNIQLSNKIFTICLSPTIQNELILLLGKNVKHIILQEVREAEYFSIMCDSTPDISYTDQMASVVRYVTTKNGTVQVKESLSFFTARKKQLKNLPKLF